MKSPFASLIMKGAADDLFTVEATPGPALVSTFPES
jgi:hypothetical protein